MSDLALRALAQLDRLGDQLLAWVGQMNLWTAGLFVLAFALDRLLASRVAAGWRVLLYVPILLRLALPAGVGITLPLLPSIGAEPIGAAPAVATLMTASADSAAAAPAVAATIGWSTLVPIGYLVGLLLLARRWRSEAKRLQSIMAASDPAPAWLRGLARDFDIVEHATAGPMLIGVRFPRLVVPRGLSERIGTDGVEAVVRHEASHVRRRDPLLAAALHLAVMLAWPVVAVWCGAARIRTLIEMACDERALRSADAEARRAYGRTLIELASTRASNGEMGVALGFGGGLRERISSLRAVPHRWRATSQAAVVLGLTILVVACSSAKVVERDGPHGSTPPATEPAASEQHLIEISVINGSFEVVGEDGVASIKADEVQMLMNERTGDVLTSPRLLTVTGQPATVTVGDDGSQMTISANVVKLERGLRTVELRYRETGANAPGDVHLERTVTLSARHAVLAAVHGTEHRTILLRARSIDGSGAGEEAGVPILADIPVLSTLFTKTDEQPKPPASATASAEYPQVLCMFNLIEADGPLYVSKDHVIEQGRNDGAQHFVQSNSLTPKTFDWFARLRGYRNVAAPAVLARMGEKASVVLNASDKAGSSVEDNHIEVRFVEKGSTLTVELTWLVGDGNGAMVPVEQGATIALRGEDVVLTVLPTLSNKAGTGRVLMLRPTIIRSPEARPVQTEGAPDVKR
jgi:beta-lactamase regulating signal transducer with metallopeptidase domain